MAQGRSTKIISMIKWIRTSRLSINNSLSFLRMLQGFTAGVQDGSLEEEVIRCREQWPANAFPRAYPRETPAQRRDTLQRGECEKEMYARNATYLLPHGVYRLAGIFSLSGKHGRHARWYRAVWGGEELSKKKQYRGERRRFLCV